MPTASVRLPPWSSGPDQLSFRDARPLTRGKRCDNHDRARQRLPFLRPPSAPHLRRSRHVAALRELSAGRSAEPAGGLLPPPRVRLRALLPVAVAGVCTSRGDLQRVRVLFIVLGDL